MRGPSFDPRKEPALVTMAQLLYLSLSRKRGESGMALPRGVWANGLLWPLTVLTLGRVRYKSQTSFCGDVPAEMPRRPL